MGCCASYAFPRKVFAVNENKPGQGYEAEHELLKLRLQKEDIDLLYSVFCAIDIDQSNQMDLDEFYRFFKLDRSPFADRVFSLMDEDQSGLIDFREFVISTWNYCTYSLPNLTTFAFQLYDGDDSGSLDIDEVRTLVQEVYGRKFGDNYRVEALLDMLDSNHDGQVSTVEFSNFVIKHPAMLFPSYVMQQNLRRALLGEKFWRRQQIERLKLKNQSVFDILGVMSYKDAKTKLDRINALKSNIEGVAPAASGSVKIRSKPRGSRLGGARRSSGHGGRRSSGHSSGHNSRRNSGQAQSFGFNANKINRRRSSNYSATKKKKVSQADRTVNARDQARRRRSVASPYIEAHRMSIPGQVEE